VINSAYARLWAGQAASLIGDFAFDTAVVMWIGTVLLKGRSYAPAVSSATLVTVALIGITVGPAAGVYVDRWDARRTMLNADLARAVLIGLLTGLACLPGGRLPGGAAVAVILLVLALCTVAAQFFSPARFVLLTQVLEEKDQSKASALAQATQAAAVIIGPPLGALLLVSLGTQWALGINAASFLVSFFCIRSVRPAAAPAAEPHAEPSADPVRLTAGLRFTLGQRTLRAMLIAAFLTMLGTGAINALDLYFVLEKLHARPAWFGMLEALFGGGTLLGAWLGHQMGKRLPFASVFCGSLLCYGAFVLVYSRVEAVFPAAALSVLFGMSLGALNTVAFPLILTVVPRSHLGRVMAVFNPANQLASLVSIGLSSLLISTVLRNFHASLAGLAFGRVDTVFTVSGVLILAGGAHSWRALHAGRQPQPDAPDAPRVNEPADVLTESSS